MRRWRTVCCAECGAKDRELMTPAEWAAYVDEDWIWLCADCFCPGDDSIGDV